MTANCSNMEEMTGNGFSVIANCPSKEEMDVSGFSMEDMDGEFGAGKVMKLVKRLVRVQC